MMQNMIQQMIKGNPLYRRAEQIRSRKVYHTNVATDVGVFMVSECELCKTSYNFPVIPVI